MKKFLTVTYFVLTILVVLAFSLFAGFNWKTVKPIIGDYFGQAESENPGNEPGGNTPGGDENPGGNNPGDIEEPDNPGEEPGIKEQLKDEVIRLESEGYTVFTEKEIPSITGLVESLNNRLVPLIGIKGEYMGNSQMITINAFPGDIEQYSNYTESYEIDLNIFDDVLISNPASEDEIKNFLNIWIDKVTNSTNYNLTNKDSEDVTIIYGETVRNNLITSDPEYVAPRYTVSQFEEGVAAGETNFYIDTAEDLTALAEIVNAGNSVGSYSFSLSQDIDMFGIDYTPIGNKSRKFSGTLYGNNFAIQNLTVDTSADYVGLIGNFSGYIENLGLENISISGNSYVGGIAGKMNFFSSIINSYVTGTITASGSYAGGLVGYADNSCTLSNMYNTANVNGNSYVGGIVGRSSSILRVNNVYNIGSVQGNSSVGGLTGYAGGSVIIKNFLNLGSVTGSSHTGGIAGSTGGVPSNISKERNVGVIYYGANCENIGGVDGVDNDVTEYVENLDTLAKTKDFYNDEKFGFLWNVGNGEIWNIDQEQNNGYPVFQHQSNYYPDEATTQKEIGYLGNSRVYAEVYPNNKIKEIWAGNDDIGFFTIGVFRYLDFDKLSTNENQNVALIMYAPYADGQVSIDILYGENLGGNTYTSLMDVSKVVEDENGIQFFSKQDSKSLYFDYQTLELKTINEWVLGYLGDEKIYCEIDDGYNVISSILKGNKESLNNNDYMGLYYPNFMFNQPGENKPILVWGKIDETNSLITSIYLDEGNVETAKYEFAGEAYQLNYDDNGFTFETIGIDQNIYFSFDTFQFSLIEKA